MTTPRLGPPGDDVSGRYAPYAIIPRQTLLHHSAGRDRTMRIRYFADFVKIERLAILPHYRKSRYGARGVAWALGEFALDFCRRKGFTRFYGHALEDLVPFWNKLSGGFLLPMPGEAPFECSGKMVVPMFGETEAKSDAITHDSGHYVIVRPEGNWDSPGYWELSEVPVKCA
ncbi:acetyltransferase [Paramagnetospirillum caucaseum]|uniref:Acetyltransferase n=2 Tax=Paramagnetospirillum caucaseum TaxID=1244869 RepID=M2Z6K0_9PROT|nr:acetyltransferase [Paramagnetospirillum caucaseum]